MALQRTAHEACSRKVHCVEKRYLDDPFVAFFAKDSTVINSPLMNRGTWLRTTAIENCVKNFSRSLDDAGIQIINFGAGMDTLYFRLKSKSNVKILSFVELDFADLIAEKRSIIDRTPLLRNCVDSHYHLLECDLRFTNDVVNLLKKYINPNIPTVLLGEMIFVYIDASIVTNLLRQTIDHVLDPDTSVELITYDAMRPDDRFGSVMVDNLSRSGIYLKGITDLPTTKDHADRCREIGFKTIKAMSMRQLYLTVPQDITTSLNKLEMIDDWDEWNLVHDHYCFLVAHSKKDADIKIFS